MSIFGICFILYLVTVQPQMVYNLTSFFRLYIVQLTRMGLYYEHLAVTLAVTVSENKSVAVLLRVVFSTCVCSADEDIKKKLTHKR